ncbi:MAG TPA: DUF5696 domain-containing protein [Clostridiales bacterium]|nr:DUF5696 domain-containing protein [Clostridiales bacterium]
MLVKKQNGNKALVLIVSLALLLTAKFPLKSEAAPLNVQLSGEYVEALKTESLLLYCNLNTGAIAVFDRRNGHMWKSTIDIESDEGAFKNVGVSWKKSMSSLFAISYINMNKNDVIIEKAFSTSDADDIKVTFPNNKVMMEYSFGKQGIKVAVEIMLEGDNLVVKVPVDKIEENDVYGLIALELMPFFGASDRSVDGYIFYPDGCGAIMKFENVEKRPKDSKPYKAFIYSPEEVSLKEYGQMKKDQQYQASLPVYGIKNGDNAFLAVVTKGEEETAIQVSPEGYAVNLNWAGVEFKYRHFYNLILSNITINGKDIAKKTTSSKPDKELVLQDHEVRFMFIAGQNANYSGMANSYREYLIKNNQLKQAVKPDGNIPLALDIFMGIKEKRMLFDKFITMTSFEQAKIITEKFLSNGVKELQINLIGWSKGGYGAYPVNWPPERLLGGISGLNKYLGYTKENNVSVFLQAGFLHALGDNGGFSQKNDIAIQGNSLPVTNIDKNRFILNPFSAFNRFTEFLKKLNTFPYAGVALEDLGEFVYHDYNKKQPSGRNDTVQKWKDILNASLIEEKPLAVGGGNAYVLKYADRLFNIPVNSSNYHINDETIPFYQMVVHGMIPYTSEPGNLFFDPVKQKLQWVEYGCMPYFELTYESAIQLKHTKYNRLFNSNYESWLQTITEIYEEFNQRLKGIWSEKMAEHKKVNDKLVKIRYSNGTTIYINYDEKETYYDGYVIEAQDYLIVEKGSGF